MGLRFTKPHDNELWVVLLEKAFAKMWGSYGYLSGNNPTVALQSFTGNHGVDLSALRLRELQTNNVPFDDGVARAITHDHKPDDDEEMAEASQLSCGSSCYDRDGAREWLEGHVPEHLERYGGFHVLCERCDQWRWLPAGDTTERRGRC